MEYQLVVIRGRSASTAVKLLDGVTTAGRQEECQLRIKSSQVSRKHCELFEKHGMLLVKDLGSSNGTFVNGKKVDGQRVMEPGDELGIGPIVFRVEKIGQPLPSKPAPAPAEAKAGDTAIAEAISVEDAVPEDEFEIDFDDEPAAFDAVAVEDVEIAVDEPEAPAPAAAPTKPAPGLAASTKPAPPKPKEPAAPPPKEEPEVADEAIADFLLGIKVDDED